LIKSPSERRSLDRGGQDIGFVQLFVIETDDAQVHPMLSQAVEQAAQGSIGEIARRGDRTLDQEHLLAPSRSHRARTCM
jgi:hypothetical protein